MIAIIGAIVLIPLALIGLLIGAVRFVAKAAWALTAEHTARAAHRLAFHP